MPPAPALFDQVSGATVRRSLKSYLAWPTAAVARLQVVGVVARAGHAHLVEDAGLQELLVAHARDVLDHLLGDRVQDVVVGIAFAEAALQRHLAQPLHHFGVAVGRGWPEQQVTGAQAQAAAMRQQVADRHLPGHERVGHAERRQVVDHLVVHLQLAVFGQQVQRGGRERLGVGRNGKQRIGLHRFRLALLAHAPAALQHHLAILDHRHGNAGHVELRAHALDGRIQVLQRRRGRRARHGRARQQHGLRSRVSSSTISEQGWRPCAGRHRGFAGW
jgi:hypothetical protein